MKSLATAAAIALFLTLPGQSAFAQNENESNKKAGDTGVTRPENDRSQTAQADVKTPSQQQQQKTNRSEAAPSDPKPWSADQDGMYDRYRYFYGKRYQAGSQQDFKSGNDERFQRYADRDTPWDSSMDADRDWRTSDYYWRETDRYWRDKARRNDPKYEEYWKNSDEYWSDRAKYWDHMDESEKDKPTKAPEGQEISGKQRVSN
jgi:hypothetical protein